MNHLLRRLAPIPDGIWKEIDSQARDALQLNLAARRLVDVKGPLGWECSSVSTGRVEPVGESPAPAVRALRRLSQELIELWAPFELERKELEAAARGAADCDLEAVVRAAEEIAAAEDRALFHGFAAGGIRGISEVTPHPAMTLSERYTDHPAAVIEAIETLREAGVEGPYGLALGRRCHTGLLKATDPDGTPVMHRLRKLMEGPIVRAPAVEGAVVLSLRGGDFELTIGEDFSVGYHSHTDELVRLHLLETITFRAVSPEAAVHLAYA